MNKSHDYVFPRLLISLILAAILTAATDYFLGISTAQSVLIQLALTFGLYSLIGSGMLTRLLVSGQRLDAGVRARAFQLFSELGVHRTRAGSGILIAISELEHRVVILADHGIHARYGNAEWPRHVNAIIDGIRNGHAREAIIREVEAMGELLARGYPSDGEDHDELANKVEHREH